MYLLSLDLNMFVHYTLSTSKTYKEEENTQKLTEENLSLFHDTVEIPMKNKVKGKYGEYGVDPILSDYDDVIKLLIFEPDKCPLKFDKKIVMKLLGMVYSENKFVGNHRLVKF